MAYRLPRLLRRHILHFEVEIDDAVANASPRTAGGRARARRRRGRRTVRALLRRQRYCGVDLAVGDAAWDYSRLDALADLTALPFRCGVFDAAIHIVTLEHLREPGSRWRKSRARWSPAGAC